MHVIMDYIYAYLLFLLDIIILQLFIPRLRYGVLGEWRRYYAHVSDN